MPALVAFVLILLPGPAEAQVGVDLSPPIPGYFDPDADLRAPKPLLNVARDSLALFPHEAMLFRVETKYDTTSGFYIAERRLFGRKYGPERVFSPERYREWKLERDRRRMLAATFDENFFRPDRKEGGALEIQVPFKIRSKAFQRIFGGDRVGLRVTGNITVDGSLRREESDQVLTTRNDQENYNFKIDQTQRFKIVGKVGDKVSVSIDQDSERLFDFENNVKLTYEGYEDEIIQSIEAGNITMSLPGAQLATLTTNNQGLFGFKTVSRVGPVTVTTIASLQQGEKNTLEYTGGSKAQIHYLNELDYVKDQYFFLNFDYRENYRTYSTDYAHQAAPLIIENIEVYKSVTTADQSQNDYEGWAVYDIPDVNGTNAQAILNQIQLFDQSDERQSDKMSEQGYFRRLEPEDYEVDKQLGYIRLKYGARVDEIIGVAYTVRGFGGQLDTIGTYQPPGNNVILKLLKPKSPHPSDSTWNLSWRHAYNVGAANLREDDFGFRIIRDDSERRETNQDGRTWLEVLGLDNRSRDGSNQPDQRVDQQFIDLSNGEIIFPDLQPFDPLGYTVGGTLVQSNLDTALQNPDLYDELREGGQQDLQNYFRFAAEYSNQTSVIPLGINVLEGSEEVYLNGALLQKDQDYVIDYLSGQITILNESALTPGANLKINYESGEVFQLDKRTMLGVRVEYALWEDSFIGGTLLYFNEQPIEKRVKVGNEPLRNTVWDLNTRLRFQPYAMTQLVNALPGIETDQPSELTFEGEFAQVFPNPNSLNNEQTGDDNGVAYIDDFEAAQQATPLSVRRKGWTQASHPFHIPQGDAPVSDFDDLDYRGAFKWFNPYHQVPIKDIWPNREVNSQVPQNTDVLVLDFDPRVNNHRVGGVDSTAVWNGIMRYLSPGYHNQTRTKYIEFMMKWTGGGPDASLYVDLGVLSEDVIPNGELDTEDESISETSRRGNDVLDEGEDTGLDGRSGPDPPLRAGGGNFSDPPWTWMEQGYDLAEARYDWWDLNGNGIHDPGEPFSDDNWDYSPGSSDYSNINGTEGNANDEVRYPDSEDLNRNFALDRANRFFRYRFRLSSVQDSMRYIRGGQDNEKGWRLVRIPIEDVFHKVKDPSLTSIQNIRLWMGGFGTRGVLEIAEIQLVGNEWLEQPVVDVVTGDTTVYLTSATINTYDNPEDYVQPPGVAGEVDPITDIRRREQSLVLQLKDIPTAGEGMLSKVLYRAQDLREYRKMKMFVHGGGRNPQSLEGHKLQFFLRFGRGFEGANRAFYEYSLELEPGWADNEIVIDLDHLTSLKQRVRTEAGEDIIERLPNGDVMRIVGRPSLGQINTYAVGVRNLGRPVREEENIEVWVDELRLSDVRKESGMAMRTSMNAKFADVLKVSANFTQRDANFHEVDKRLGSDNTTLNGSVQADLQVDKFFDPNLGLRIPLRGSISSNLRIPKYTTSNGDVRTESLAERGELNIWKRYSEMALSQQHYEDRFQRDAAGDVVQDTVRDLPLQDLNQWGIDTLFTTEQKYSWGTSFGKTRPSNNWLLKLTVDKINARFDHTQRFSSDLQYQYQKHFTNNASVDYRFNPEKTEVPLFGWTEDLPVLGRLADTDLNYLPTNLSGNVNVSEARQSLKYRNSFERANYNLNMTRGYGIGFQPFRQLNMDFKRTIRSEYIRQDSTRQILLYDDQPDVRKKEVFKPGTPPLRIIEITQDTLRLANRFQPEGDQIADSADALLNQGVPAEEVVDYLFTRIESLFPAYTIKEPWERRGPEDSHYDEIFWNVGGMPFTDVHRSQTLTSSFSPAVVNWLTTSFNYSSTYNWNWQKSYSSRSMGTATNMGANFVLRMRQIFGSGGRGGGRAPQPGSFGPQSGGAKGAQDEGGRPDLLKILVDGLRKLQDIRMDYSQTQTHTNPARERGNADLAYQLGLTGDPGVDMVEGYTQISNHTRSDDYRISSGVNWSSRISTSLDYNLRLSRSDALTTSGTTTHSAFFLFNEEEGSVNTWPIPNYSLRWSGLEQIGPLKNLATAISLDHSFRGTFTENWQENAGSGEIEVTNRSYERSYSPLAGITINWKYGIQSNIRWTWSQTIRENAGNNNRQRDTRSSISFTASYTRRAGFRIPLPIWPFKGRSFENETTFSLAFDSSTNVSENQRGEGAAFERFREQVNWSITPSMRYRFSNTVDGGVRYKYGVTQNLQYSKSYQEFGINVNIAIRG